MVTFARELIYLHVHVVIHVGVGVEVVGVLVVIVVIVVVLHALVGNKIDVWHYVVDHGDEPDRRQ